MTNFAIALFLAASQPANDGVVRAPEPVELLRRAQLAAIISDVMQRHPADRPCRADFNTHQRVIRFLDEPFSASNHPPSLNEFNAAYLAISRCDEMLVRAYGHAGLPSLAEAAETQVRTWLPGPADVVAGLADFIVDRAKDEAAYSFLLALKRHAGTPFMRTAFRRSWALIDRVDTELFQIITPTLRMAVVEDMNDLPRLVGTGEVQLPGNPQDGQHYFQSLALAYGMATSMRRGVPAPIVLSNLTGVDSSAMAHWPTRHALRLVGTIAGEYVAAGGSQLMEALTSPRNGLVRRYFMALAAQEVARSEGQDGNALASMLRQLSNAQQQGMVLVSQLHSVSRSMEDSAGPVSDVARTERTLQLVGALLQVAESANRMLNPAGTDISFTYAISDATHLQQSLLRQDYGSVVTWLVTRDGVQLDNGEIRFLSFAASMAGARSTADVTTAIRTASAPVGSFRRKRSQTNGTWGPVSASLSGYVGVTAGFEGEQGIPDWQDAGHAGVAVPVGIELTLPSPLGFVRGVSLLASVLDVGTIASARIGGASDVEKSPNVGLRQVVAPGLFLMVHATRDFPVTFGLGLQNVSNLRTAETPTGGSTAIDVTRFSLIIGLDAPLFQYSF